MQLAELIVTGRLVGNDAIGSVDDFDRSRLMRKQEDAGEKGCRQDRVAGYFSHRISAIMMSIE